MVKSQNDKVEFKAERPNLKILVKICLDNNYNIVLKLFIVFLYSYFFLVILCSNSDIWNM